MSATGITVLTTRLSLPAKVRERLGDRRGSRPPGPIPFTPLMRDGSILVARLGLESGREIAPDDHLSIPFTGFDVALPDYPSSSSRADLILGIRTAAGCSHHADARIQPGRPDHLFRAVGMRGDWRLPAAVEALRLDQRPLERAAPRAAAGRWSGGLAQRLAERALPAVLLVGATGRQGRSGHP